MSQSTRMLKYLRTGRSLTPLKALHIFGCLSLSQRMGDLRRSGQRIGSMMVRLKGGKRVKEYWIAR